MRLVRQSQHIAQTFKRSVHLHTDNIVQWTSAGSAEDVLVKSIVRLALRLHAAACGNIIAPATSSSTEPSASGASSAVVLPAGKRGQVAKDLARLLVCVPAHTSNAATATATESAAGESTAGGDSTYVSSLDSTSSSAPASASSAPQSAAAAAAALLVRGAITSALAECGRASASAVGAGRSAAAAGLTAYEFLICILPELEDGVLAASGPAMTALERGVAINDTAHLQCNAAAVVLEVSGTIDVLPRD
jgi:hypothetical protein